MSDPPTNRIYQVCDDCHRAIKIDVSRSSPVEFMGTAMVSLHHFPRLACSTRVISSRDSKDRSVEEEQTIFDEARDRDTLGGRIGRAREITGMTGEEAAVQLGVTLETWENWEADREEPRANRLAMLAGFLNVSASWLLYGIGESPSSGDYSEIVAELGERLAAIEENHAKTAEAIDAIKATIERLGRADQEE